MAVIEPGRVIEGSGLNAPLRNAGAPTTATYLGVAVVGSELVDTVNGKVYVATAVTPGVSVTWAVVGSQS